MPHGIIGNLDKHYAMWHNYIMSVQRVGALEGPTEQIRNALQLLDDMERTIRGLGLILDTDTTLNLYHPLVAARGRLWRAVELLERPANTRG